MDLGLSGKVAIITGGSAGIGRATAGRLVAEGCRVVIAARRPDQLNAAASEISGDTPGSVLPVVADVTVPDDVDRVLAATLTEFGRVDILVNNAGTALTKGFEDVEDAEWRGDFDLKVWPAIRFARAVVPEFRKVGGGRIVNVTNLSGRSPGPASMPTSISRAAGIALTKGLSRDLGADNILVNTVCIGYVKSEQHERDFERQQAKEPSLTLDEFYRRAAQVRDIPLGRVGETDEAADVIAFLVSSMARYVTGVAINIDGGTSPLM